MTALLLALSRWLGLSELIRHKWIGFVYVEEPGISDDEGGRWGRMDIWCTRCGEQRRVWRGLDFSRNQLAIWNGCGRKA